MMKTFLSLLLICTSSMAFAVSMSPGPLMTYEGILTDSNGTPITGTRDVTFQIIYNTSCVAFEEKQTITIPSGSNGEFSVVVGSGNRQDSTSNTADRIFASTGTINCSGSSATSVTSFGNRSLHIKVDGTDLSPDITINNVPTAINAMKLADKDVSDFVLKALLPICTGGTFLSWNGTQLTCNAVTGATGGTVTEVDSTNSYISIINNSSNPQLTLNVGTTANTVAAGNDPRLVNALATGTNANGDLSGTYPGPTVVKIQGVAISASAPTSGQFFKYNGTNWIPSNIATADIAGLSSSLSSYLTQSTFNGYVASASCGVSQTMYWNSVSGNFQCQAINVGLAGDVTGSIGAAKVVALQGSPMDATAPTVNQVLKWNGTKWTPTSLQVADLTGTISASSLPAFSGDVTSTAGSATLTLTTVGTAGAYYKVTTDAKGRVVSGVTALAATDIPGLDWSKITSGKPTTLAGYGISDSVIVNAGGSPSIQSGLDTAKPASPTAGAIYIATDSKIIYQYLSGAWTAVTSSAGGGGTITGLTAGTGLTGGGTTGNVTLGLVNTGVTAGSYTRANITVDAQGRITAASTSPKIDISSATDVTGTLPIASGGTGTNNITSAFNILSPLQTKGQIIGYNGSGNVALDPGTNGQVLTTDSTAPLGIRWVIPNNGTVTNVTANAPITVASGTTTPVISVNAATTAAQGVVQVGAGIAVSSGTISADPANFPSIVPVGKGGTGASTMAANGLVAANATGSAYVPFACSLGQTITFNGTGVAACSTYTSAGIFVNGGNSFGAPPSLGTNDNYPLTLKTNSTVRMLIDGSGNIGIGTTIPTSPLYILSSGATGDGLIYEQNSNTMVGASFVGKKSYGVNGATPASVPLVGLYGFGHNGSSYETGAAAAIEFVTSQAHGSGAAGTDINFRTTTNNSTGSANRMTISNSGKVLIGSPAPASPALLHIVGSTTTGGTLAVQGGTSISPNIQLFNSDFVAGTAGSVLTLGLSGSSGNTLNSTITAGFNGGSSAGNLVLQPVNGNVGIGTSSPTEKLSVSGNILATGTVTGSSDRRFKRNIAEVPNALNKITSLRGVSYDFRTEEFVEYNFPKNHQLGVIAQEVEPIFPEAVNTDSKTGYKSVAYTMLISPLIEALKEVRQWLIGHDREIASLKAENEVLKKQLEQQQNEIQEIKKILKSK